MSRRIRIVLVAIAFYLLGFGTTGAMAQGDLTLEGLAEMLAALTGRVDRIERRLSALEATPEPTSTPRPTSTRRPTATPRPTSTPRANTITITRTSNVRAGPGTDYNIVGQSEVGTMYRVTGKNAAGDWYRIDYNGQAAWIWTGLTNNRNLAVPVVRTPVPPPSSQPAPTPARGTQTIIIDETRQSYWAAPSETDWRGTLRPGPGKYAVPPGEYVYVCTKTGNNFWHKILVPGAPDGWVWIRAIVYFLDEVYCDS